MGSLVALPFVFIVGWPPAAAWPYILTSLVIHIAYYTALTGAYQHGDLGLTYPLMRGTAPLLVALSATMTVGESLTPVAWAGVLGVSCGVLALGLSPHAFQSKRAVAFALANAVVIALYTVVDAIGSRTSGAPLQYVLALFVFDGWPFALLVLARRPFAQVWPYARRRAPVAVVGAAASLGSYGIALWAMTLAPVAAVAALRETSILFATTIAALVLRERVGAARVSAVALVACGAVAMRLA
jgi:drug/metabolite transporter (DMT)-like permease